MRSTKTHIFPGLAARLVYHGTKFCFPHRIAVADCGKLKRDVSPAGEFWRGLPVFLEPNQRHLTGFPVTQPRSMSPELSGPSADSCVPESCLLRRPALLCSGFAHRVSFRSPHSPVSVLFSLAAPGDGVLRKSSPQFFNCLLSRFFRVTRAL